MTNEFTKDLLVKSLEASLAAVESKFDELNALDAATGDGDHGTAIVATLKAAVESAKEPGNLADTLSNIAMGVMSATGGSTSSLNGSFYMGMSGGVAGEALDATATVKAYEAGLETMGTMTSAKVGDKTMMDALIPASEAIAAYTGADEAELFTLAAEAAEKGAADSANYVSKFGRAKSYGAKTIGTPDAGAVSMAKFFTGLAK